jgi:hypothetical protein
MICDNFKNRLSSASLKYTVPSTKQRIIIILNKIQHILKKSDNILDFIVITVYDMYEKYVRLTKKQISPIEFTFTIIKFLFNIFIYDYIIRLIIKKIDEYTISKFNIAFSEAFRVAKVESDTSGLYAFAQSFKNIVIENLTNNIDDKYKSIVKNVIGKILDFMLFLLRNFKDFQQISFQKV